MAARKPAAPVEHSPSLAPFLAVIAVFVAVVGTYFKVPGFAAAWVVMLIAAFLAPQARYTGKKDSTGRETPAHEGEKAAMRRFLFWKDLRFRLLPANTDMLPGWPVAQAARGYIAAIVKAVVSGYRVVRDSIGAKFGRGTGADGTMPKPTFAAFRSALSEILTATLIGSTLASWLVACWTATALYLLPYHSPVMAVVNAAAGYILVCAVTGARRRSAVLGDRSPGVRLGSLPAAVTWPAGLLALTLASAGGYGGFFYGSAAWAGLGAIAGVGVAFAYNWRAAALADWEELCEAREQWEPYWKALKHDPAPRMLSLKHLGPATAYTFSAPAATGAAAFDRIGDALAPSVGEGIRLAILSVPNVDSSGNPIPGSRHPLKFQVVSWPVDAFPSMTDLGTDPEVMSLFLQSALVWTADGLGAGRPMVADIIGLGLPYGPADIADDLSELPAHFSPMFDDALVDVADEPAPEDEGTAAAPRRRFALLNRLRARKVADAEPSAGLPDGSSWLDDGGLYVPDEPVENYVDLLSGDFTDALVSPTPISAPDRTAGRTPVRAAADAAEDSRDARAARRSAGRPVPADSMDMEPVEVESGPVMVGGSTQAWCAMLALPEGPPMGWVRENFVEKLADLFGCPVVADHRSNALYFGALFDDTTALDPQYGVERVVFEELATEDLWNSRWAGALKMNVNQPVIQHKTYAAAKLTAGVSVHRLGFTTRNGQDPMEFSGLESKLAATMNGAPYVSIAGWNSSQQGRAGVRHHQAFSLYWSETPVPSNPDTLSPPSDPRNESAKWVLVGRMNEAFAAARLARPEVYDAVCLTRANSRGHIWKISLRLYGGVTLADVRGAQQRIKQHLASEWLRVEAVKDGCVIVAGVSPARARLTNPGRDAAYLASLDWEQAFLDSKVSGVAGLTPRLLSVETLPHNDQVSAIEFELPAGLSLTDVKDKTEKLKAATNNAFVEVRSVPGAANKALLLVCETNPLRDMVPFNFDLLDAGLGVPFATGVEGEPIFFDAAESPHLLVAGTTGSGKSVLAQDLLFGFACQGAELHVIDPVKGGADFVFVKPYAKSFASTPKDAATVMKAVYAEVERRKTMNAEHGVGSVFDLPNPPQRIVVFIDEFTSLMIQSTVPARSDDPTMDEERERILSENQARAEVGMYTAKLAREARSAGVTLLLGTQKLAAAMLDKIPGAGDLKVNLARTLLGKGTYGDRQSALRAPDEAPPLGDSVPKGRGLWEPLTSTSLAIQTWYATQAEFSAELASRRAPLTDDEKLALDGGLAPAPQSESPVTPAPVAVASIETEVVELDAIELSLDDLDLSDISLDLPTENEPAVVMDVADIVVPSAAESAVVEEFSVKVEATPEPEAFVETVATAPTGPVELDWDIDDDWDFIVDDAAPELETFGSLGKTSALADPFGQDEPAPVQVVEAPDAWDEGMAPSRPATRAFTDADFETPVASPARWGSMNADTADLTAYVPAESAYGWSMVDAVDAYLSANPSVSMVVWSDPQLDDEDELGVPFRATVLDLLTARGVQLSAGRAAARPAAVVTDDMF